MKGECKVVITFIIVHTETEHVSQTPLPPFGEKNVVCIFFGVFKPLSLSSSF